MGVVFLVIMGVVTYRQHPPEKKWEGNFFFPTKRDPGRHVFQSLLGSRVYHNVSNLFGFRMMRQILLLCSILALSSAQAIQAKRKVSLFINIINRLRLIGFFFAQ